MEPGEQNPVPKRRPTTLCMNVAGANDGRATRLHDQRQPQVILVDMDSKVPVMVQEQQPESAF